MLLVPVFGEALMLAGLVAPGQPAAGQADGLLDDAVALFTQSAG